jgi:stage II sporulation protein AA (anti-sigma F factor antagonist)
MKSVQFNVTSRLDGDVAVIYPKGYLNNLSGESLVIECGIYIGKGITKIVVNFSETDLINSIGISMLLQIIEDLRNIKGTICCTNMSKFLRDTFEMLGLIKHMLVFPVESDALKYLKAGKA